MNFREFQKFLGKKEPEPDATPEEIAKLKLNYEREMLKTNIAKEKASRPKSGLAKVFAKVMEKKERKPKSPAQIRAEAREREEREKSLRRNLGI